MELMEPLTHLLRPGQVSSWISSWHRWPSAPKLWWPVPISPNVNTTQHSPPNNERSARPHWACGLGPAPAAEPIRKSTAPRQRLKWKATVTNHRNWVLMGTAMSQGSGVAALIGWIPSIWWVKKWMGSLSLLLLPFTTHPPSRMEEVMSRK